MRGATHCTQQKIIKAKISIHTPHAGSDLTAAGYECRYYNFNPHSPCGERLDTPGDYTGDLSISIHTPHAGSDLPCLYSLHWWLVFQSTLPMRGATIDKPYGKFGGGYFNPHSPCGERRIFESDRDFDFNISIHTPHAGSDRISLWVLLPERYFNPHSPCGERRRYFTKLHTTSEFQSTLPMRGATPTYTRCGTFCQYFNPHSPCGERRVRLSYDKHMDEFQSTLPMRGATAHFSPHQMAYSLFQSTLPMRGATRSSGSVTLSSSYFNPHSPCGERHGTDILHCIHGIFQSTLPMRGATFHRADGYHLLRISIHTPHAGSDGTGRHIG